MTMVAWAVGREDSEDGGLHDVKAETEAEAIASFCRLEGLDPIEECGGIVAMRVPNWDTLERVTMRDWFYSGVGLVITCDDCGECCANDETGREIDGRLLCETCVDDQDIEA